MIKLAVIGTSKIIEEHIKVAIKNGFFLHSIASTRANSKKVSFLKKKI